ncbi:MAG: hypothetical protein HY393_03920 [Candidatus Diapherotrites archaeon]|nr:hypothetical protein [Candidatus Diapherotrites archaeon]
MEAERPAERLKYIERVIGPRMNAFDPEDYSVDQRTTLAKQRTLLAHQRVQLNIIGIGLGLFATGFTLLKFIESAHVYYTLVEVAFILGGTVLTLMATLQFHQIGVELRKLEVAEEQLAHAHKTHTPTLNEPLVVVSIQNPKNA